MKQKSIKVNFIFNISRVGFNLLFPIVVFPYVSRILGPTNFGKVNFAISIVNYFVLFASLGIPSYGTIICAREKTDLNKLKHTICELFYINLFCTIIAYCILIMCVCLVPSFYKMKKLLLLNSLTIFFTTIGLDWLYNALEEFKYISIRSIFFKLVSFVLIFLMVKVKGDYFVYSAILIFATVGSNILNLIHARKYLNFYSLKELNITRHVAPILTFFAASIASTINANTDTVLLGFLEGNFAVGLYAFSVKIKSFLVSILTAGLSVVLPRLSALYGQKKFRQFKETERTVIMLIMYVSMALSIFFAAFSKRVILILGGRLYLKAQVPMVILTLCVMILGITWTLGVGVLQATGRAKIYSYVMWISCLVNVVLNFLLVPLFKVSGSAIATLVTEFLNAVLFFYFSKEVLGKYLQRLGLWKILLSAVIAISFDYMVNLLFLTNFNDLLNLAINFILFMLIHTILLSLIHKEFRIYVLKIFSAVPIKKVS